MTIKKSYYMAVFLVAIILGGCEKKPYSPPQETKEETKARYDKLLACKLDKPLSKGELYEKAMVQYWQYRTYSAFGADYTAYEIETEKPKEYRNKLAGNEYQIRCGLTYHPDGTPDKVTRDVCYPYQVYQFDDLKDFYFGYDRELKNKNLNDFIANNKAQVYRWDKQPPIYTTEHYSKDVDFMVMHSRSSGIYPKDCCKLLSYEEILNQEKNNVNYSHNWDWTATPIESLSHLNFLSIKLITNMDKNNNIDTINILHPVTKCGDILTHTPNF